MTDSKKEIERRLSVLQALQLSGVNRAADMLTLAFGAQRPVIKVMCREVCRKFGGRKMPKEGVAVV